jgi:hypothetical protein
MRSLLFIALAALASGCATARPDAALVVACPDAQAQLYIDESYAGLAASTRHHPLALRSGFHRVEVRAAGKLSAYREVTLAKDGRATLSVELRPDLDQADAVRP